MNMPPYTKQKSGQIPADQLQKNYTSHHEMVEEQIVSRDFDNVNELKQKTLELCSRYEPQPIFLAISNYSLGDSFLTSAKYQSDDPSTIFECIVCKRENDKKGEEVFRIFGKYLNSIYISAYAKQHSLPKLHVRTNIKYDKPSSVYNGISDTDQLESELLKFNKILENDTKDYNALLSKGWILDKLERYDEAVSCYDKILQALPDHKIASTFRENALKSKTLSL